MKAFSLIKGNIYCQIPPKNKVILIFMALLVASPTFSFGPAYANSRLVKKTSKFRENTPPAIESSYSLNLKQLGASNPITLRGQDGRNVIEFNVRVDEVIKKATLKVNYKYSPDLLSEQSQINIYLNGESLSTIEISPENGNKDLAITIEIPPELFSENNQFTFQLVGHYSSDCEDPDSPKLWAQIGNQSKLELTTLPILLPNDLTNLPIPLVSKYDSKKLVLPFIFHGKPDNSTLEAAGILSSWLASNTNQTGSQFPTSLDTLPTKGNAVIFIVSPGGFKDIPVPIIEGPSVFITSNPKDSYGKLLFVMGRNSLELKQAATSLAISGQNLSGHFMTLDTSTKALNRRPYDAPNWLNSYEAIKLQDINNGSKFNIQIPPALFTLNQKGIPLNLDYSYPKKVSDKKTDLDIFYKSQLIKSIQLPTQSEWAIALSDGIQDLAFKAGLAPETSPFNSKTTTAYIPQSVIYAGPTADGKIDADSVNMAPFLSVSFFGRPNRSGDCARPNIASTGETKINGNNSTIDISRMSHFIKMPNLSAFANSGFPFSQLADLSETAVVLSDNPKLSDYDAYLAITGRLGRLTGYPSTLVTISSFSQLDAIKDKDLIVIMSGEEIQPALKKWEGNLSVSNQYFFNIPKTFWDIKNWIKSSPSFDIYKNTFLAGFESPLKKGRSVVLLSSPDPAKLIELTNSLDGESGRIYGSLVRLNEGQIELVSEKESYELGSLPWYEYLGWMISEYISLFILISIFSLVISALMIYAALNAKRKKRLEISA